MTDVAPGQYDDRSYELSKNSRGFTIGERREVHVESTVGPGAYDATRGDSLTRTRSPNVNMGTSSSRAQGFAQGDSNQGPGQYDDRSYEISKSSRGFTIGEKRGQRHEETVGPGAYDPDRADSLTKTRSSNVNMGSSPSRTHSFAQGDSNQGPGQYDDRSYELSKKSRGFTIGERREVHVESTVGPGAYDASRGDSLTKTRSSNVNMGTSSGRAQGFAQGNANQSSGYYDDRSYEMSKKSGGFTIGEKREKRQEETAGPGSYSPEQADKHTRN